MAMAWHEPERGEARPGATGKPIEALPGTPDGPLVLPEDRRRVAKRRSESPPGVSDAREKLTIRLRTSLTPELRQLSDERNDDRRRRAQAATLRGLKPSERGRQRVVRLKVRVPQSSQTSKRVSGRPQRSVRAGRASFTPPASPEGSDSEFDGSANSDFKLSTQVKREPSRGSSHGNEINDSRAKSLANERVKDERDGFSPTPKTTPKENPKVLLKAIQKTAPKTEVLDKESKRGRKRQKSCEVEDDEHATNDWCSACGGTGRILCCDSCSRSYHFTCAEPPIDQWRLPAEWFCRSCEHAAGRDAPPIPGVFGALGKALDRRVPLSFQLPRSLREHFERVATDEHGDYTEHPFPKIENTEIGLCYRCQEPSVEPTHPLGTCERCGLHWHADCLPEPQSQPALPARWTCPLHAERTVTLPRRPRKPTVTDVALARQVPNDGQIDVASDSEPDESEGEEEIVKTIPFLPVRDAAADYVSATLPSRRRSDKIIYRLKERTIKLDFIDAVNALAQDPWRPSVASDLVVELDDVASRPHREREAVRDLMELSLQGPRVDKAAAELNLRTLVDAALSDEHEQTQIAAIKRLMQIKGREKLLRLLSEDN